MDTRGPSPAEATADSLIDALGAEGLRGLVAAALEEDLGPGDLTSSTAVPPGSRVRAVLRAKAKGVLAGLELFREAFLVCDAGATVELLADDGDEVEPGAEVARMSWRRPAWRERGYWRDSRVHSG